jgi:hypothetical protein
MSSQDQEEPIVSEPQKLSNHMWITDHGLEMAFRVLGNSIYMPDKDCLIKYSNESDRDEVDMREVPVPPPEIPDILPTWCGHFYNPFSKKNYLGELSPTALTRCIEHYEKAMQLVKTQFPLGDWIKELGRSLHYMQDATCPFHAANDYYRIWDADHSEFENFATKKRDMNIADFNEIFLMAHNSTVSEIL